MVVNKETAIKKFNDKIKRVIITEEEINLCKSCVYDGFYILSFDNKTFILNIDNYYYKYTSAYHDSNKQNRALEWFYWEYPKTDSLDKTVYLVDSKGCHIVNFYIGNNADGDIYCHSYSYLLNDNEDKDIKHEAAGSSIGYAYFPIETMLQTKLFDFGLPDRYKKIEQVYIGFGEAAGKTEIHYVTDSGTKTNTIPELKSSGEDYSPEYIKTKRLLPNVNRAARFGIKINCLGRLAINDLIVKYKFIGGIR